MTTILLYAALTYWGICALFALGSLFVKCPNEDINQNWELLGHLPMPRRQIAMLIGALGVVLLSPVFVPFCLVSGHLADRRQAAFFAWLKGTHRENVYERIHPVKLPELARRHFEQLEPEMLDIGFHVLGRYLLKPQPAPSYGYCFQSPDARTVGVLGQMFDSTYFSYSTLFANGMALETASVEETPSLARVNESSTFRAAFAPGATIAEAYAIHEENIAAIELEFNTRAFSFEPDQFRDVLTYEGRLHSQFLHEIGEHAAPPPQPVLPTAVSPVPPKPTDELEFEDDQPALVLVGR
jgi:hypothetical protein